ncbi:MAG TPA: antitoxin Xre/MbcA/ParS toxin-binding domain-containing protein [Microbacteriaceae bacterium]|nr:antitoxin Xre/MbcA/ParS toxin-binding domain-containing protein [Microbacteriaceae bacterium]
MTIDVASTKTGGNRPGRGGSRSRRVPTTLTLARDAGALYDASGPVSRLIDTLGNNVVADLLGVSRSQPSRWRSGAERLSPQNRKRVSDLDYVLDRLLLELYPEEAGLWLTGSNPHLGGARPIDVLILQGVGAVLPAIDALATGAFA